MDVLESIARQEGWTLEYVEGSWEECLERLKQGKIDLLVAIGYTLERARIYDFTSEIFIENWGQVYVRRNAEIRSLLDLTDRSLAVMRGDVYYDSLWNTHAALKVFPKFVEVGAYADTLRLVSEGKADAALVPRIFGAFAERKNSKIEKTSIMFFPVELRFAAPKGRHADLLAALDRHMAGLREDKRSIYYRARAVWLEGRQALVLPEWLPKWLNPYWLVGGITIGGALVGLLIAGMNLLLHHRVRVATREIAEHEAAQAKITSELRIAQEIQMSFIPQTYPPLSGWEIHGELRPAREVGGDFYDCFLLDDGRLYFILGDVSGKGVPAALFMAVTKTLLAASATAGDSPAVILDHVNRQTSLGNDKCMFVTAFCGILHPGTGRVVYTNAGHNPPLALRAGGRVDLLESGRAPALGFNDDARYGIYDIILGPGDALFMYTDGVTEAMDRAGAFFSEDGLLAALAGDGDRSARELATTVLERVTTFASGAPQADDIAVLVVRRAGARLHLRSRLPEIERLADEVARLGREHALPDEVVFDLRLALEEAVANAIRHGYGGREDGEVSVSFRVTREAIMVTVEDDAPAFDPLARPDPPLPPEASGEDGVGVYLIKRLMDEVDYRREGSRNVLTLTKRIGRATCR